MATFNEVKASIDENITGNGEGKITGGILNGVLNDMVGATEGALNEKAPTTYVDERLAGVLSYVDNAISSAITTTLNTDV